ncbi:MAG TPA: asparagine synthase (glutamine-hydrolyzing) [Bacteroidales bacterium]|nr:asparagine synthase (glutamine-hydrolyzing) [Bacteroidales bacterium]
MCGIIGKVTQKNNLDVDEFVLQRDVMYNRGPDNPGLFIDIKEGVALGYRRLSIVDLSEKANQPFANENGTIFLVCNGEIYNAPELRKTLSAKGHIFKSFSDNEVILHGYEEWGNDIVGMLQGMFALGIWDANKRQMFIARDRYGIKPLYYELSDNTFTFASSIKAITSCKNHQKNISLESVCNYLTYRYVPSPATIYEHIYKVEPGCFLILTSDFHLSFADYWSPVYNPVKITKEEAEEQASFLLKNAVKKHLLSDVPLGCFLSGGIDSSALAVILKDLKYNPQTFSIGFDGWGESEHLRANKTASMLGFSNVFKVLNEEDFLPGDVVKALEEPIADISIVPTFFVSKIASNSVKAVFSGEGADELFGGYDWYYSTYNSWRKSSFFNRAFVNPNQKAWDVYKKYMEMGRFDNKELKKLFNEDYHKIIPEDSDWFYRKHFDNSLPFPKSLQKLDVRCFMGELVLNKVDKASMANSLEVRVPYLDNSLFDFVFNLKPQFYFTPPLRKPLLATISNIKKFIPDIAERKKQGFVGPDSYYHRSEFFSTVLNHSILVKKGIFNKKHIDSLIEGNDYWRIWKLVILDLWLRENIN